MRALCPYHLLPLLLPLIVTGDITGQLTNSVHNIVRSDAVKFPLYVGGKYDDTYQLNIAIGTPPQLFNVTVDTYWHSVIVLSKGLVITSKDCPSATLSRRLYDVTASSTSTFWIDPWNTTYAKDYPESFSDPRCKDSFWTWGNGTWDIFKPCAIVTNGRCVSSVNSWTEGISLIQAFTTPINPYWQSEGAFGLGFSYSTDNPVYHALKQFQQQQVTLALKRREVLPPSAPAGYLTFGGSDNVNCDAKWNVGARGLGDWKVTIKSLHVGLLSPVKVFSGSATGWFQTATAFIVAPAPTVDQIVRLVKAEYDHASDRYVIDCAKARSAPTLRFGLDTSMTYDVPAKDYVRKFERSDGRCVLMLLPIDNVNLIDTWLLGTTFNRAYCAMFDNKKDILSFSKTL